MTRAPASFVCTLLLLATTTGLAQHAGDATEAALPVTILPGEIPGDPYAEGVPDLGFDAAWEWHALVCRKKCELEPVKLLMTPVQVPRYDAEPVPGHRYAIDRELDAHPLVLLRDLPSGFRAHPKTYLHAGLDTYPSSTPGTMEIDIPSGQGELARIVPRLAGIIDSTPVFKVYLETKSGKQLLAELRVDTIGGPASLPRRQQMLRWAGDLDGDDKLDLIMNFNSEGATATLFLSSQAKPGEMVGLAGAFSYSSLSSPGC